VVSFARTWRELADCHTMARPMSGAASAAWSYTTLGDVTPGRAPRPPLATLAGFGRHPCEWWMGPDVSDPSLRLMHVAQLSAKVFGGVDHRCCGVGEVVPQLLFEVLAQPQRVDGGAHVAQPGIVGSAVDAERCVAHAQARMAAAFAVGARAAPVLHEEEGHALLCRAKVFLRVHGAQERVLRHALVEAVNQLAEGLLAADRFKEGPRVIGRVFDFASPFRLRRRSAAGLSPGLSHLVLLAASVAGAAQRSCRWPGREERIIGRSHLGPASVRSICTWRPSSTLRVRVINPTEESRLTSGDSIAELSCSRLPSSLTSNDEPSQSASMARYYG
jgi:hypothetical protein